MSKNDVQCYELCDFQLDLANHHLTENGIPIWLTQKNFELLEFLIEDRGRILPKAKWYRLPSPFRGESYRGPAAE